MAARFFPLVLRTLDTKALAMQRKVILKVIMQKASIRPMYSGFVASIVNSEAITKSQLKKESGIYRIPKIQLSILLTLSIFFILRTILSLLLLSKSILSFQVQPI